MAKTVEFEVKIKGDNGSVLKNIVVEATNADAAIEQIVESASRATDNIRRMAESGMAFTTLNKAISEVNGMIQGLAAPYNSFEDAMAKVNTMAGANAEGLEALTDRVQEISEVVPLAREALADGLYQTISAGVPEAQWLEYLNTSARSAVGGCADLSGVVKVTSGIIKAYGADWEKAGEIQDKIQQTAKLGVTSFEELSQALPRVTGNAATLGVQIDELMAVFATTTNVTGNTAEVSTQLAAVLNSLVKPSSEATKAAQAMGISFDAASVKSAGGLKAFLLGLDSAIEEYAAKTGTLSETIYGQLFGSAEALRLLGSLTGKQRETFSSNIQAMADSTGAMDAAFEEISSTGNANATMMQNWMNGMIGWAGSVASAIGPYAELFANVGASISTFSQLCTSLSAAIKLISLAKIQAAALAVGQKAVAAASLIWKGVQMALNVVLSANPIGIVVMAIAALVAGIILAYNNCEEFRAVCDKVWAVVKDVAAAVWEHLVKAFEACSKVVKKAWEWVKNFFGISDSGPTEAQTEALEENTQAQEENAEAQARTAREAMAVKDANDWQTMSYEQLGQAIEAQKVKVAQLAGTNSAAAASEAALLRQMQARYKQLGKSYNLSDSSGNEYDGKSLIRNATTYKELGNNIQYYQDKLEKTKPSETAEIERLSRLIVEAKQAQEAIEGLQAAASRPVSLNSLGDYDKELQYLQTMRDQARGSDAIAEFDAKIAELTRQRAAVEAAAFRIIPIDNIDTYEGLSRQLEYYQTALKTATGTARTEIQGHIVALENLKESWDDTLAAVGVETDASKLNSLSDVEKALTIYNERRRKASADELDGIMASIAALERKKTAIEKQADLSTIKADSEFLGGLGDQELKMKLRVIGADEINRVITTIKAQLATPALNETDAENLQALLKQWQGYGSTVKNTMSTNDAVTQSMGGMSDMLSAISSMTDDSTAKMLQWGAQTLDACAKAFQAIMAVTAAKAAESVADIPVVGWILAGTAIASVIAAFASIPKFADGGIAYGPTLGLFGEYAGAASNPEVVAPLDRLRSLISPAGDSGGEYKTIRVEIPGRKLVALLRKENAFEQHR